MPGRIHGLDRLRGAALVLMLVHHLVGWFGGRPRSVIPGWDGFAVTDVAAPAFTIALGASVALLLASRRRADCSIPRLAGTVLRRYGLLVPIGLALRAAMGFDLTHTGVLETLGISAIVVAAVVSVTTTPQRIVITTATLLMAPAVERAAAPRDDWLSEHVLTGTFPLVTYIALALVGACAVDALRAGPPRGVALSLGGIGVLAVAVLALTGDQPDRYPGDASFLVPGIAGTLLLHAAVTSSALDTSTRAGELLQRAGSHTFGVFVSHYAVYFVLRETGMLHAVAPLPAVAAALATTLAFVWLAPSVPTPPWTPRAGWRRDAPPRSRVAETDRVPVSQ